MCGKGMKNYAICQNDDFRSSSWAKMLNRKIFYDGQAINFMFMWTAALTQMNSGTGKCIYENFLCIYENRMEDGEFFVVFFFESEKRLFSVSWQIDQKCQNSCSIPQLT